eukprot:gene3986-5710_t
MLKTTVGNIILENCVYNASGPRTGSIEALIKIAESDSGAILAKSATLVKQDGNILPRFLNKVKLGDNYCDGSINSEGLPNSGIDYYISTEAINSIKVHNKPYIISLSGLTLNDNMEMFERVLNTDGIASIELNLACPNVPGKPIIAYDFDQMELVLRTVTTHPKFQRYPVGVKLAPYFDIPIFEKAASIIAKFPIKYVVSINTIGNALFIDADNECEAIAPKQGLGGLGGGFVKHTALANVRMMRQKLDALNRSDIDIVAVGGVHSGKDAFEFILCGAKAVQVGTCHWTEGPTCFKRISDELKAIMQSKGYKNIEDFRGKLKPYTKPTKKIENSNNKQMKSDSNKNDSHMFDQKFFLMSFIAIIIAFMSYFIGKMN